MDTYGLVGYPLKHSFSKGYFNSKFSQEGIDAEYLNFEIENISLFPDVLKNYPLLKGLNITIPYKEKIIPYLDEIDPQAKDIGAINVVKINRTENEIKLIGYNTDIIGFQNSISPLLQRHHTEALILGSGGASKAVYRGLLNLNITPLFVSRTPKDGQISYADLTSEILDQHKVIINTTPLGTFPNMEEYPDIPYKYLRGLHLLYDLVYNPAETSFLRLGKESGATIKNGAEMLELQAKAAWNIWNS